MRSFARALWAEVLKLKRSLVLCVVIGFPLALAVLALLSMSDNPSLEPEVNPWISYQEAPGNIWMGLMSVMQIGLITALLCQREHRGKMWTLLYATATPRSSIYAAKWAVAAALTLCSTLCFLLFDLAGTVLLGHIRTELVFALPIPLGSLLVPLLRSWVLSLFLLSLVYWVSLRSPSFFVPAAIGFGGAFTNIFLANPMMVDYTFFLPTVLPARVTGSFLVALAVALVGASSVILLGLRDTLRRDVL